MNELDMDFGYALYETTVDVEEEMCIRDSDCVP